MMNNQCDGCQRGIPVVNGIHKDEQDFGMMCTKGRYKVTSMDIKRTYGMTPRGSPMPQTIEEWKHLVDLDEKVMLRDKETISKLKIKINRLEQKLESHNGRVTGLRDEH